MFLKWTHAGDIICVTDSLAEKTIANLPGEHARALGLGFGLFFAPFFLFFKTTLYSEIFLTTAGVEILGLDPPISRGLMLPVS